MNGIECESACHRPLGSVNHTKNKNIRPIKDQNFKNNKVISSGSHNIPLTDTASAAKWPKQVQQAETDWQHLCGAELDDAATQRRRVHVHSYPGTARNWFRGKSGDDDPTAWCKRGEQMWREFSSWRLKISPEAPGKL
jgi:hypothetical protein